MCREVRRRSAALAAVRQGRQVQRPGGRSAAAAAVIWQRRSSRPVRTPTGSRANEVDPTERGRGGRKRRESVRPGSVGVLVSFQEANDAGKALSKRIEMFVAGRELPPSPFPRLALVVRWLGWLLKATTATPSRTARLSRRSQRSTRAGVSQNLPHLAPFRANSRLLHRVWRRYRVSSRRTLVLGATWMRKERRRRVARVHPLPFLAMSTRDFAKSTRARKISDAPSKRRQGLR